MTEKLFQNASKSGFTYSKTEKKIVVTKYKIWQRLLYLILIYYWIFFRVSGNSLRTAIHMIKMRVFVFSLMLLGGVQGQSHTFTLEIHFSKNQIV